MKKPVKKRASRKTAATRKPKRTGKRASKTEGSLESRLEREFAGAVDRAKLYVRDRERLRQLVTEAARKAASLPRDQFKETWAYLQAMLRLVRAYNRGEYRQVPMTALLLIIGAVVYLINPLDLLPDWIPGLGLLDDAFILQLAVRRTRRVLDDFMNWEIAGY